MLGKLRGYYNDIVKFLKGVRVELTRVTWPSWPEVRKGTIVVIVILIIVSAYMYLWGKIFAGVFRAFHGH
ncbi:MAG: preprotein translocase subunit SecE [Candidatus Eremiobacteraeota bacterium]|nr:preprotein translocase subunit SecE [Candidatus Eremiobacteraeota bacterium]